MSAGQMKVDRLLDLAFFPGRAPRSHEYREGCAAALEFRVLGVRIESRYPAGSCGADAWAAGVEEGHAIWRANVMACTCQPSNRPAVPVQVRAAVFGERKIRDAPVDRFSAS